MLGLGPEEEEAYRTVVRRDPLPYADVARATGLTDGQAALAVDRLRAAGLVEVRDGVVTAAPPEATLARVVDDEERRLEGLQGQLEGLRRLTTDLAAEHRAARRSRGEPVTLRVIPFSAASETLRSLAETTDGDLLWLRPDQWRLPEGRDADRWVHELLRGGRRSRAIYPTRAIEEAPEAVRRRAELGERVRVLEQVPGRLAVVGDVAAVVSQRFDHADDTALVIEQPALVRSMTLLFESLWTQALVVPGMGTPQDPDDDAARRLLLDQLARGAKDEQIARALGISLRTVRRRVSELMVELNATSRFQAGVEAVRQDRL